jgi:adenine deaminase
MIQSVSGNLIDILQKEIYAATITFENGRIISITKLEVSDPRPEYYILPGFIDAHVHIESSMLVPSEFARVAVVHGTVSTVSDPHEIANVCGIKGIEFMIENGKKTPFKFNFGAPSCVPATKFETAGATLDARQVGILLQKEEIKYLSEMMNFPGVLHNDEEVMKKIMAAQQVKKPVDGHAPGLRGEDARKYIQAGISTDHECFTREEALEKLGYGMKIIIREGSAAKNFDALIDLLNDFPDRIMFCSDDKHPDSLVAGHINQLCARAVARGIDLFKVLGAACVNPVQHYSLNVGLLKENDPADFILVKDLRLFEVLQTYIDGKLVASDGRSLIDRAAGERAAMVNNFQCSKKETYEFEYTTENNADSVSVLVIEALDGQLITNKINAEVPILNGKMQISLTDDILKLVVVNRYREAPVAKAFIKNFGLTRGAIASSVAHDSHNIVAAGVDDESICRAVNLIIEQKGGVSCVEGSKERILALPVSGLMSDVDGYQIAESYTAIDAMAKGLGSKLSAPFMTLSFMALLVIPHIKLSDKGLFDADAFRLI